MRHQHHSHRHGEHHGPQGHGRHEFPWGGMHRGGFGRGRWHEGGRGRGGRNWGEFFSEGRGGGWGGPWGGPWGGRERMERGMLRHVILSVLKDGPRHGYEIIKHVEERTHGLHSPSPGALYPTLQYLEDLGLVRSEQQGDKRVYHLTDSGRAELDKQQSTVDGFWSRFHEHMHPGAGMHELKFAGDALKDLMRTLGDGFKTGAFVRDADSVRRVREALERCQNEIRQIITQSSAGRPSEAASSRPSGGEPTRRVDTDEDYVEA
jgi:DNA-binding PadR family transcriptional regulator